MVRARRVVAILLVLAIAYFGYLGFEASRLLAHPNATRQCRTPAKVGWVYEAINYDIASDEAMRAREGDPWDCSAQGEPAGDAVVSSDGIRLAGWWIPAGNGNPDAPTVVMTHGWGSNKSGNLQQAAAFHDTYDLVLYDLRNHGQSGGTESTQGILEQRDLVAMIDWLEAAKGETRIALFGESMGGHTAANVAARDARVDALILDSTHDRLQRAMVARIAADGKPFAEVAWAAVWVGALIRTGVDVFSADPIEAVDELGDRPLLIMHGGGDFEAPTVSAHELAAAAEAAGVEVTLRICEGATHGRVDDECPTEYRSWVNDFLAGAFAE